MRSFARSLALRPRTLRSKLLLVYTLPVLLLVVLVLLYASRRRIEGLQERQIAVADSVVHALTQDLRRIELLGDQGLSADLGVLLASFPSIEYLVARNASGERIFYYARSDLPLLGADFPTTEGVTVTEEHLYLTRPLEVDGVSSSGSAPSMIYLCQDREEVRIQARQDLLRICGLGCMLAVFALLGSLITHRVIVRPIEDLSALARSVAETKDYTRRAVLAREDEIGTLARGLDHLLERIDHELISRDEAGRERERLISELERRNKELERITHSLSHDLRNPLVTIRSFAGLLQSNLSGGRQDEAGRDLERITLAADQLGRLFEDLLEVLQLRPMADSLVSIDFEALICSVLEELGEPVETSGARVRLAERMPSLVADPVGMREVFRELVENALAFGGDGGEIEIGAERRGGAMICHVRDAGIGVEPDYHERIFGMFERLDPSRRGTGAGLAIVQQIVEAHGGRVWVESEGRGRGSTFFVSLPQPGCQPG